MKGKREIRYLEPLSRINGMEHLGASGVLEKRLLIGAGGGI